MSVLVHSHPALQKHAMHYSTRARLEPAERLTEHREWIPSREALRLVMGAYASHDFIEYPSNETQQVAAMERATEAMLRRLTEGSLLARSMHFRFAQGNRDDSSEYLFELHEPERTIDPNFWRTLQRLHATATFDWIVGDFCFDDCDAGIFAHGYACGVMFDISGLPALSISNTSPSRKAGGAPRKWDWDGALLHLTALAHYGENGLLRDDGSDPNQSDIARHLQEWFIDTCDNSPESSQLRNYGKRFVTELNALKLRAANKSKSTR